MLPEQLAARADVGRGADAAAEGAVIGLDDPDGHRQVAGRIDRRGRLEDDRLEQLGAGQQQARLLDLELVPGLAELPGQERLQRILLDRLQAGVGHRAEAGGGAGVDGQDHGHRAERVVDPGLAVEDAGQRMAAGLERPAQALLGRDDLRRARGHAQLQVEVLGLAWQRGVRRRRRADVVDAVVLQQDQRARHDLQRDQQRRVLALRRRLDAVVEAAGVEALGAQGLAEALEVVVGAAAQPGEANRWPVLQGLELRDLREQLFQGRLLVDAFEGDLIGEAGHLAAGLKRGGFLLVVLGKRGPGQQAGKDRGCQGTTKLPAAGRARCPVQSACGFGRHALRCPVRLQATPFDSQPA